MENLNQYDWKRNNFDGGFTGLDPDPLVVLQFSTDGIFDF